MGERTGRRDIPFGPQFSPEQTPLPDLLGVLESDAGDYARLVRAIRHRFFEKGSGSSYNKTKKADNTTLALRDYGILDEDKATLTAFGHILVGLRTRPPELYEAFARHILLNKRGLDLVRTIQDLNAADEEITLETLPGALAQRGIHVPATSTHLSAMKGWLRMAGVFVGPRNSYEVDGTKVSHLLGSMKESETEALGDLNPLQRAFLKALARFPKDKPTPSNDVARLAETLYGVTFPWKSIRSSVLDACAEAGLISFTKTTAGRGAKPHLVQPTAKFDAEIVLPLLEVHRAAGRTQLREALRTPLAQVIDDLGHPAKHTSGKALELLALRLMFTLGLEFAGWRKRGRETGGAEVDVIVENASLAFSRWQIQCKIGAATLEDVAKEVGLTAYLLSNVIVVVTARGFTRDTRAYADQVMRHSNLQIVLLDRRHLDEIVKNPARLVDLLAEQARHAMTLKRLPEGR